MAIDLTQSGGGNGGASTSETIGGGVGTAVGTAMGGPLGGAIGGVIGSTLGGLFGGGGEPKPTTVRIQSFPCPKVNNKGLSKAWWWADKIAMAVSVWAAAQAYKAAREQYKIGKRYYDLAHEQWRFFYDFYRPLEEQELAEIFADLPHNPDYTTATKGHTHLIDETFHNANLHRVSLATKYCVCEDVSQFVKAELMQSTISGDSDNFARRYAEKLAQERNDIRWARRIAAASRGRGLLSSSAAFASKAAGFYNDYASSMGGLAGQAQQFRGYINNRNDTVYNAPRQRINSRATVPNTHRGFDAQTYWQGADIHESTARGGLDWDTSYGKAPYQHSGFDPSGMVDTLSQAR